LRHLLRPSIGLVGRIVAVLLLAIVLEFGASALLYESASKFAVREDEAHRLAEHLVISRRLVAAEPAAARTAMAQELSTNRYGLQWTAGLPPLPPTPASLEIVRRQVIGWEPGLATSDLRFRLVSPREHGVIAGGLSLPDGSWLYFRTLEPVAKLQSSSDRVKLALIPALALMVLGGIVVRRMLLPLRRLADAADRFDGGGGASVPESGPAEVRRVTSAFNRMQARIQRLIVDRTQALAAVGHDLRTPLARLKLRADGIDEREVRSAIEHDVDEMEAMIGSLLSFLGGDDGATQFVRSDVAVLCATIVDAASDAGHQIDYIGPDHVDLFTDALALRRAIDNLVNNAVRYGERVSVVVSADAGHVSIAVEDDGPGIPPESLARVLEPFVRLDDARARDTVGFGLGLAIVNRTAQSLDGRLTLSNRPQGGLRAAIVLPVRRETLSHDSAAPQQNGLAIS